MTKKVKKLLNAAHAADRDSIPVFCDADGIFYIPRDRRARRNEGGERKIRAHFLLEIAFYTKIMLSGSVKHASES